MTDLQPLNGPAEEEGVSATGSGKVESDVEASSERDTRTTVCPIAQLRSLDMVAATAVGLHAGTADAPLREFACGLCAGIGDGPRLARVRTCGIGNCDCRPATAVTRNECGPA